MRPQAPASGGVDGGEQRRLDPVTPDDGFARGRPLEGLAIVVTVRAFKA
jgi:hypothetical protein